MDSYRDRVAGAQITLNQVQTIGSTSPGVPFVLFRGAFAEAEPRVLRLGGLEQPVLIANVFPPTDRAAYGLSYVAGMKSEGGERGIIEVKAACILRYGAIGVVDVVAFDWRVGAYNLPPCDYVEVAAMCWGTGWSTVTPSEAASILFSAAVLPGQMQGALVPTVTDAILLTPATPRIYDAPRKASAMDAFPMYEQGTVYVQDVPTGVVGAGAYLTRDAASGYYFPPWTPVQITPASRNQVACVGVDVNVLLRYYLQL